jgi:hypothetical protein
LISTQVPNWTATGDPLTVAACFGFGRERHWDRERGWGVVGEFTRVVVRRAPALDGQFDALTGGCDLEDARQRLRVFEPLVGLGPLTAMQAYFARGWPGDVRTEAVDFAVRACVEFNRWFGWSRPNFRIL